MPGITQTLTPLPTPPNSGSPGTFAALADAFLAAFPQLQTEINAFISQANALAIGSVYGQRYTYLSATTNADPGAGKLKLDNAVGAATKLYLSETDADGNNMAATIATWDDNAQAYKGQLRIIKASTPTTYVDYAISGALTDNGTWVTFNLTYIGGNGAFANNDPVVLQYQRAGADGVSPSLTSTVRALSANGTVTSADNGNNIDITAAGLTLTCDTPAALNGSSVFFLGNRFGVLLSGNFYNVLDGTVSAQTRAVPRGSAAILTSDGTGLRLELIPPTYLYQHNPGAANYTLQLVDAGAEIFHAASDATARAWTIPANAAVPFPIGTVIPLTVANGAGAITLAITTDTLRQAGSTNTGPRTLAANASASIRKISATEWVISGSGVS